VQPIVILAPALFANHTFVLSFGFEKDDAGFFIWKSLLKLQNIHGQNRCFDQVTPLLTDYQPIVTNCQYIIRLLAEFRIFTVGFLENGFTPNYLRIFFFVENLRNKKVLLNTFCTDPLEMCFQLLEIKVGDEVIMPSFNFVSTANAFILRGPKLI
jgi:hypothetical protein